MGGLGVDSISKTKFLNRNNLEKKFNFKFNKVNFIINFHPETLNKNLAKKHINELLLTLKKLKDTNLIFTVPGPDLENKVVIKLIKKFIFKNKNAYYFKSLGQLNYFSFLNQIDGMIGNSSSGLLEMPYFKKGTINLGKRQSGRMFSNSVINVNIKRKEINFAIKRILSKKFLKKIKNNKIPYGLPGATSKIIKILKKIKTKKILDKNFFDIKI